ncbi:MAG: NAD(P)-binding protein [Parvularculaceae bacterium]
MGRLKSDIDRRDFLNGMALSTALGALSPAALFAAEQAGPPGAYPPGKTGLRGAHAGAFETAHARAWEGKTWPRPQRLTDNLYDLVVIGAGLSGLAAAFLYRERHPSARILILDNHDDFGGHAKRNEFSVGGRRLIGHGGSQSIDGPAGYSAGSKAILSALGVDVSKFYGYFDQDFYARRNMRAGMFLDQKTFGAPSLTEIPFAYWSEPPSPKSVKKALSAMTASEETRSALKSLVLRDKDLLNGKTADEKTAYLRSISYETFLRDHANAPEELIRLLRPVPHGIWGVGWDALSALEAARWSMPGTSGLALGAHLHNDHESEEPYIFHFPDGNASLARLLVRKLVPAAISGGTMEDIVLADADYSKLDLPANDLRIRLSSTVVDIAHSDTRRSVDVVYVENGAVRRVRGRHAIMAGYMAMTPHICAEMAEEQKDAIRYFTKIPLVYVNIALTNWRAFDRAGFHRIYCPGSFCEQISLDFPVSIGDYRFSASPDEPIVLHLQKVPTAPELGLNEKDQHRAGRRALYALSYDDFETAMVEQLTEMLEPHGFDASKDIAGITVNLWPHGYAYEYNELYDGPDLSPAAGPHLAARERIGRISFANSDTSAYAYVNGAFDAAIRAVGEQAAVAD